MINTGVAFMYQRGFWIRKPEGLRLAKWLFGFLISYMKCVKICNGQGANRFALTPKLHMFHHAPCRIVTECGSGGFCINPLAESVQIQEDYIGRPSRLSRRSDIRALHKHVVSKALICARHALEQADGDQRGFD